MKGFESWKKMDRKGYKELAKKNDLTKCCKKAGILLSTKKNVSLQVGKK